MVYMQTDAHVVQSVGEHWPTGPPPRFLYNLPKNDTIVKGSIFKLAVILSFRDTWY